MITLKEIAAEAGVSVMTVSNVIHNNLARVSPETAEKIRAILEKHHYVPNMAARSLISKASRIVAVLLPLWEATADSMLLDPYTGQMAGMLETLLREKEYYVMLCSFQTVDQVLAIQRTWQIDGSILIVPHRDEITHELVEKSVSPLVVIDRKFDDLKMMSVCLDDRKGSYLATKHLLENGHRRIGFACPSIEGSEVIRKRYQGYLDALGEYCLTANPAWVFDGYYHQEGGETVGRMIMELSDRPSAMVTTEDLLACGVIKACQAGGLQVPRDMSVVGFDNSSPSRLITPGLTTIAQDVRQKAEYVVNMLLRAIGDSKYREDHIMMDVELVTRESVYNYAN
ncbi:MAG: LacI family DNA-binding transcriptional regulator [Clostridia bacterium]|nr:LacI family DNA-binding transcriptional regulator [Clostridia bacterium]